jgi:hypothetical protein
MRVSDFTQRTLRTWAVVAALHAALLAAVAVVLIPWKTAWVNGAIIAYALLQAVTAPGLWRTTRWGWKLGLVAALLGLAAGVAVVTGLLSSWLYLKAVYGVFGYGASLVSLLFAAVAFQLLGLVPALELRALLRREVRRDLGTARGARFVLLVLLWLPLLSLPLVFAPHRLVPVAPVSSEARSQSVALVRAALEGEPLPATPALEGTPLGPGPLYVSLWSRGKLLVRVSGHGGDLVDATRAAAQALRRSADAAEEDWRRARIKIDRVAAVGGVLCEIGPVVALSVVPGVDGLRRRDRGQERVLLPDDMIRADRFGLAPLLPRLGEVRLGLDARWALEQLAGPSGRLERLSLESWLETPTGATVVDRGRPALPPGGASEWREAALRGGRYLLRSQRKDGRFVYRYRALDHRRHGTSDASLARHAGAVYALSQLYRDSGAPQFATSAERAAAWLVRHRVESCEPERCVVDRGRVKLGSSALGLIGLLEYQRSVGDDRFAAVAEQLARFVLRMERPGGGFYHRLIDRQGPPDPEFVTMFASEQAALALLMAHDVFADEEYLRAAERALDHLTTVKYDYFLGWFTFGADHWTCIAAEEAWPRLRSPAYLEFCRGYADFVGRMQFAGEPTAYAGHYGFSGIMVPQAPATAGFTEAIISTYELSRHHGRPDEAVRRQMVAALEALRQDQLRADDAYLARKPRAADGAIRRSPVQSEVRIDFVQHALSALIRGAAASSS